MTIALCPRCNQAHTTAGCAASPAERESPYRVASSPNGGWWIEVPGETRRLYGGVENITKHWCKELNRAHALGLAEGARRGEALANCIETYIDMVKSSASPDDVFTVFTQLGYFLSEFRALTSKEQ